MTNKFDVETKQQFQLDDFSENRKQDFIKFKKYADGVYANDIANAKKEIEEDKQRRRR